MDFVRQSGYLELIHPGTPLALGHGMKPLASRAVLGPTEPRSKSDLWAALVVGLLSLLTVGGMQWLLWGARLK